MPKWKSRVDRFKLSILSLTIALPAHISLGWYQQSAIAIQERRRHQATPQRKYPEKKLNLSIASDSWCLTLGRGPSSPAALASTKQGNAKSQRRPSFAWIGIGHTPVFVPQYYCTFCTLVCPSILRNQPFAPHRNYLSGAYSEKRQKHNRKVAV